jgi:transposase InsO family protein
LALEKCTFGQKEISFLGKIIDSNGQRPDPDKLLTIRKLPQPTDITQLRAFLGAINWYGEFLPHLKDLRGPLDEMLRKGEKFEWSPNRSKAFENLKQALHANLALTHYDPNKPLVVAADASSYGIGATLLQREADGSLRPVMHTASSFNDAERNYPQVEREALALVFAVKKFHRYIYGRQFELHTDHKPLLRIFGSKSGMPVHTANRLRRYALTLLGYDFSIRHINGEKFAYADFVSRLIESHAKPGQEDVVIASIRAELAKDSDDCEDSAAIEAVNSLPVSREELQQATKECDFLKTIISYVKTAWPQLKKQITQAAAADYWEYRAEIQVIGDCVFIGDRPIIPPSLRRRVLEDLHEGHPGISRMQALARSQCFWPGIYNEISSFVKRCENCAMNADAPRKEELRPWPRPSKPWQRLHIDFAGLMAGDFFFIVVDAYSNWPEVVRMRSTTAEKTVEVLEEIFARWGPCATIVSDNGPQFISSVFRKFCKTHAVQHITSAPYHPQSNGRAERFVSIMKTGLKKLEGEGNTNEKLRTFLATYRRTPSATLDGKSPFEMMTGRKMPTRLDQLLASARVSQDSGLSSDKMAAQFDTHHGAIHREFQQREPIYYLSHQNNAVQWCAGTIVKPLGAANYEIDIGGRNIKAHVNQLKKRFVDDYYDILTDFQIPINEPLHIPQIIHEEEQPDMEEQNIQGNEQEDLDDQGEGSGGDDSFHSVINDSEPEDQVQPPATPPPRNARPQRMTKPPAYLKDFVLNVVNDYVLSVIIGQKKSE